MDGSFSRHKYVTKRSAMGRRRRKPVRGRKYGLKEIIAFQSMICAVLAVIIIVFKVINMNATNFIIDRVKNILTHNTDFSGIFSYIEGLAADVRDGIFSGRTNITVADGEDDTNQTSSKTPTLNSALTAGSSILKNEGSLNETEMVNRTDDFTEAEAGIILGDANETDGNSDDLPVLQSETGEITGEEEQPVSPGTWVLSASSKDEGEEMIMPVEGTIAAGFGEVVESIDGSEKMHLGIDICVKNASSVKAAMDGKVAETGLSREYGRYVKLEHDDGFYTIYANCHSVFVQEGEEVRKGDAIAGIGYLNISAGNHLHFEVWDDGEAVDPLLYINLADR